MIYRGLAVTRLIGTILFACGLVGWTMLYGLVSHDDSSQFPKLICILFGLTGLGVRFYRGTVEIDASKGAVSVSKGFFGIAFSRIDLPFNTFRQVVLEPSVAGSTVNQSQTTHLGKNSHTISRSTSVRFMVYHTRLLGQQPVDLGLTSDYLAARRLGEKASRLTGLPLVDNSAGTTEDAGRVDVPLRERLRGTVQPEPVLPGETRIRHEIRGAAVVVELPSTSFAAAFAPCLVILLAVTVGCFIVAQLPPLFLFVTGLPFLFVVGMLILPRLSAAVGRASIHRLVVSPSDRVRDRPKLSGFGVDESDCARGGRAPGVRPFPCSHCGRPDG